MDRTSLERLYAEAGSLQALGKLLGVSASTARTRLARAGVALKPSGYHGLAPRPFDQTNREELQAAYDAAGSVSELARRQGVTFATAYAHLKDAGITVKKSGYVSPGAGSRKRGAAHYNWKGGTYPHADGYIYQYAPDHPAAATAKGYVLQHRLVMEAQLGRILEPHEIVHHKNGDKQDNRPENLELTTRTPHMRLHKAAAERDEHGRFS